MASWKFFKSKTIFIGYCLQIHEEIDILCNQLLNFLIILIAIFGMQIETSSNSKADMLRDIKFPYECADSTETTILD